MISFQIEKKVVEIEEKGKKRKKKKYNGSSFGKSLVRVLLTGTWLGMDSKFKKKSFRFSEKGKFEKIE